MVSTGSGALNPNYDVFHYWAIHTHVWKINNEPAYVPCTNLSNFDNFGWNRSF